MRAQECYSASAPFARLALNQRLHLPARDLLGQRTLVDLWMTFEVTVPNPADLLRAYSIHSTRISPHNLPSLLSLATYSAKGSLSFHSASSGVEPRALRPGTSSMNATNPPSACRITLPVYALVLRRVCGKLVDFG